jgi:hypothetical protein
MSRVSWDATEPGGLEEPHNPPSRRSGEGAASILPYLLNALKTKGRVPVQPQDAEPGIDFPDSNLGI